MTDETKSEAHGGANTPFEDAAALERNASAAVAEATQQTLERNIPIVYLKGGRILREYPDGRVEDCEPTREDIRAALPALGVPPEEPGVPERPTEPTKRFVRIFAGPNGSGKSTIYEYISKRYESGVYINADRIQGELERSGSVCLDQFGIGESGDSLQEALARCSWTSDPEGAKVLKQLRILPGPALAVPLESAEYGAAIIADILRNVLVADGRHFSFETVMSHESKIAFMRHARQAGYKCYLYFVCTQEAFLNLQRVQSRVLMGGHNVPSEKVVERYYRSLGLLRSAIRLAYRAFIFDNSSRGLPIDAGDAAKRLCVEFQNGVLLHRFRQGLPRWTIECAVPIQ